MTLPTFLNVQSFFGEAHKSSAAAASYHFVVGDCKMPPLPRVTLGLNWARQGSHKKGLWAAGLLKAWGLALEHRWLKHQLVMEKGVEQPAMPVLCVVFQARGFVIEMKKTLSDHF